MREAVNMQKTKYDKKNQVSLTMKCHNNRPRTYLKHQKEDNQVNKCVR